MVTRLSNQIDADCLFEANNATDTVDYNDIDSNQTAGLGIVLTVSNDLNDFTATARKLDVANVPAANRFFVASPQMYEILLRYLAGKESALGDRSGEAGNVGKYMGFDLFLSNALTGMIRWTPTKLLVPKFVRTFEELCYIGGTPLIKDNPEGSLRIIA